MWGFMHPLIPFIAHIYRKPASVGTCRGRKNVQNQSFGPRSLKQSSLGKVDKDAESTSSDNGLRPTGNSLRLLTALKR